MVKEKPLEALKRVQVRNNSEGTGPEREECVVGQESVERGVYLMWRLRQGKMEDNFHISDLSSGWVMASVSGMRWQELAEIISVTK